MDGTREHWQQVYRERQTDEVSWYQAHPAISLRFIEATGVGVDAPVIDVGGGASRLVDCLLERGFGDVTVLDVAPRALEVARARLGEDADRVDWIEADVSRFTPTRRFHLWHDRAVFHFLVDEETRAGYLAALRAGLAPGGALVLGTFATGGPRRCSGLPIRQYDAATLCATLGDEFELLDATRLVHRTPGDVEQLFAWFRLRRRTGD
ncbi:MAG: class I SAM-dependent methyltransferase [Gammaproteobacteria bacterium]|nr:class I SAM-dependent methyltransferase [Gammaproteobacteria bacterium]